MTFLRILIAVLACVLTRGLETGAQCDEPYKQVRFVGSTFNKALFVFAHHEPLWHTLDYCIMNGLYPATIQSVVENEMVAAYAGNYSRPIWLPAMDHGHEGTFTWLANGGNATTFSEWDSEYAIQNRSANCLVMGTNGKVHAESCKRGDWKQSEEHLLLCESKLTPSSQVLEISDASRFDFASSPSDTDEVIVIPNSLVVIGEAGGKLYYYNEDTMGLNFGDALDICHLYGMRLATPETTAEQDLLRAYALQLAVSGHPFPYLWTSGSDVGTPNCTRPNSRLRWLTTLTDVEREVGVSLGYRHSCVWFTPSYMTITSCCEGCQAAAAVCEMAM